MLFPDTEDSNKKTHESHEIFVPGKSDKFTPA